jgi:prepilin-type N-terminal cleavage/methylation domain-containing protein
MRSGRNQKVLPPGARRRLGVSLIEVIVAIGIIGILASIGIARINAPDARLFANDVKAMLEQARYEAVRRHTPVAVVWSGIDFEIRPQPVPVSPTSAPLFDTTTCTSAATPLRSHDARDYRSVSVSGGLVTTGVVWLPSGLVRSCDGTDLETPIVTTVNDGRRTLSITLSPAGAVTGP